MTQPPTQEQVERIVRSLTPAQRCAVKADGAFSIVVARRLAGHGLLTSYARLTGENWVRLYWSDLGIAVRQAITKGSDQ